MNLKGPTKHKSSDNSPLLLKLNQISDNSLTPSPDSYLTFQKIEDVRQHYLKLSEEELKTRVRGLRNSKIKGLEEIGIFSEFEYSKNIYPEKKENFSFKTIHITDFMRKDQKMKLLRLAGECQVYKSRKEAYKKEEFGRDFAYKKFFLHSEKDPKFFNTPQASPRVLKDFENDKKKSLRASWSEKTSVLDGIIEQCNKAIKIKPRKIFN